MSSVFYRAVTHTVLLFGLKTWVLSVAMEKMVEGTHNGFLRNITGKWERRKGDGMWSISELEKVREATETQLDTTCIERIQEMVAQWVAPCQIFEIYARKTGYEG